jgi:hypothetical protein
MDQQEDRGSRRFERQATAAGYQHAGFHGKLSEG